jgi:hypothetical protein
MLVHMARGDDAVGDVVDLVQLATVCAAVVACYDRLLVGDPTVPHDLDRALSHARALGGVPGRLGWALDLVGRGASGASSDELTAAIETLRRAAVTSAADHR